MSKEIFDQDRPRSTMAQRLDEAFAGCEEWTVVSAPRRRRPDAELRPSSPDLFDGEALADQEPRAA